MFAYMKKHLFALAALSLLFACTPEENGSGDNQPEGPGNGEDNKIVHVTGISLDRNSATIKEGESIVLAATVTPDNADNKSVSWSSSGDAVATVDAGGKVTGIKAGSATITATTEDGGKKATCSISVEANLAPSVTIEAKNISAVSAVLAGKANLGSTVASDLKVGFQYSKSAGILPSNSTTIEAQDADASYNYTTPVTGLEPATKYYFRSFIRQNGQDTYGETKEFTTKEVTSLLETRDASEVEAATATLNAKLDLTDVLYTNLAYGFLWGTSESALNTDYKCTDISDNAISASLKDLSHKVQYWYKAYAKLDNQTFYGGVMTFTTDVVPVGGVSLDKTEYTFHSIGNTLTLQATVLPVDATDKSVSWTSDNEDVATIDANGRITAKGNGVVNITVTTKDQGKKATCVVTVAQWVTSISLDKTSLALNEGQEQLLAPTVYPSNAVDKSLNWTSSNTSVATVDTDGKITAISKGNATIKAESKDGSGQYASCSVNVIRPVSSIELSITSLVLYLNSFPDSETLFATVTPSDASNTALSWTSSNTSVATVSSHGVVEAESLGTATITVAAKDGNGAQTTCEVEVRQYVTSISIDKTMLSLEIGEIATLSVTSIHPDNANDKTYSWSSSDSEVASVDNSGKVTAKAKGKATITVAAKDGSGVKATCSVVVSSKCPTGAVDMGITTADGYKLYWATTNIGASKPEDYGDYYAWGETETKENYSWSTYKFGTSETGPFSKYNTKSSYGTVDNKKVLEPEDDVAIVKLGGKWRMPTDAEFTKLRTKCTWTWVTNYNGSGINGRLVKATNGNSIFLPAAGARGDITLYEAGFTGSYWSSSLYTGGPSDAWFIYFISDQVGSGYNYRCWGYTVRPVSD